MKQITLSDGRIATIENFKGKHIREAQRVAGDDLSKMTFAMIAQTTSINGTPILMEDLDEMDGTDVLTLMGEFGGSLSAANT